MTVAVCEIPRGARSGVDKPTLCIDCSIKLGRTRMTFRVGASSVDRFGLDCG